MRCKALIVLVVMGLFTVNGKAASEPQRPMLFGLLTFKTLRDEQCNVSVRGTMQIGEHRRLSVICGEKVLFVQQTSDFLIDIQTDTTSKQRFFIRWEGGQTRLQILEIERDAANKDVIVVKFNESSEFMPDVLQSPDVLLVHREKHFDDAGRISPTRTDVFAWKDDKYVLQGSWKWLKTMQYENRFCILQMPTSSCPATPVEAPTDR